MDTDTARILFIGTVAAAVLMSVVLTTVQPEVYINGHKAEGLSPSLSNDKLQVPLNETARLLGARVSAGSKGGVSLRWGRGNTSTIPSEEIFYSNGERYLFLERLAHIMDLELARRGKDWRVKTQVSEFRSIRFTGDAFLIKFDRFAPVSARRLGPRKVLLTFYNCQTSNRSFNSSPGDLIRKVNIQPGEVNSLKVKVTFSSPVDYNFTNRAGAQEGRLLFVAGVSPAQPEEVPTPELSTPETLPRAGKRIDFHTITDRLGSSTHTLYYLEAKNWREHFDLETVIPERGVGSRDSLRSLISIHSAVAGINANFFDPSTGLPIGLVVRDGEILSDNWGGRAGLAVDSSGTLNFLRPSIALQVNQGVSSISVDDINRPIGNNELIVYTENYAGEILGNPGGSKTVVHMEGGRIVSTSEATHYIGNNTEYTLVASGYRSYDLQGLEYGEEASFEWNIDPPVPLIEEAVSAGPLLIKDGRNVLNIVREDFSAGSGLVNSAAVRSVVATTKNDSLLFIVVKNSGISLHDLPELLLSSDLNIDCAMALDGGSSAGVVYRQGSSYREVGGSREIPVGLALVPKNQ